MKKILLLVAFVSSVASGYAQMVTTVLAGNCCGGGYGGDGGPATSGAVYFSDPFGFCIDSAGDIFIADAGNYRIRKVNRASGIITTIAGDGDWGYYGDGGPGPVAKIGGVYGIAADRAGNCYIADADNYRLRRIDNATGVITTVAGTGSSGFSGDGGTAASAGFDGVGNLFIDTADNIYICDYYRIRKIDAATGIINTIAGGSSSGFSGDGGPATSALLNYPYAITGDKMGNIYFSDINNLRVRKMDAAGIITTIAGGGADAVDGRPATSVALYSPGYIGVDSARNIYFSDYGTVRKIDVATGMLNIVLGNWYTPLEYQGRGLYVNDTGDIFTFINATLIRISGARPGIGTCSVSDTLASAPCILPDSVAFGVYGTLASVPSSTDSMTVTVDYGDNYIDPYPGGSTTPILSYRLPYTYSSGSYYFGAPFSNIGGYTYHIPGIYHKSLTLATHDGYRGSYPLSVDTVGANCDTTVTGFATFSVWDTLSTGICVFPSIVNFLASGSISGTPSATDSVYIVIKCDDTAMVVKVVPYVLSGSVYTFSYAFNRLYTTPGEHNATVYAITSSGYYTTSYDPPSNVITNCHGGSFYANMQSDASVSCTVPDTVSYVYWGYPADSSMLSPTVAVHAYFGDGTDSTFTAPVTNDGHGRFSYSGNAGHIYTLPGLYNSHHYDTAGIYVMSGGIGYGSGSTYDLLIGTSCAPVTGCFYIDANANCVKDSGEVGLAYWPFAVRNDSFGTITYGWCDDTGGYAASVISSYNYTILADPFGTSASRSVAISCPSSGTFSFYASAASYTQDFAFSCVTPASMDMSVSGWGWGFVPGDTGIVGIWSSNPWGYMCDTLSADVVYVLDTNQSYIGMWSGPSPTSISGDTLRWHFTTAGSLFDFTGYVKVRTDTSATVFDTIRTRLYVTSTRITDPDTTNNTYIWRQPVRASWDPNEKQVSPVGYGPQGYIPNGTPLSYMVHFQNTGSAPARNISVTDTISTNLDLSTLQVVSSSSAVLVYQLPGNVIKFRFNDINLPDSASDPTGSIGYIAYNILPYDSLAPGTTITNKAGIYFDYNPPVYTNSTINTIEDTIGVVYGPDSVCTGATVTLSNHATGGTWHASNTHANISPAGILTGLTPGFDTITYTLYEHQLATKIVYVNATPGSGTVTGASNICTGTAATFTTTITGGGWAMVGTGIATVSATGVVTGIATGTDTVIYTGSNTCGTGRAAHAVNVIVTPAAATITGPSAVCEGASVTLSASGTGGTWGSTGTHASVAAGVVTGLSAGADSIRYTTSNMCGSATAAVAITVNPVPFAGVISGGSSVCAGSGTTVATTGTGGAWSSINIAIATISATGSVAALSAGTDTLYYTATNSCGTAIATRVLTVNPLPVAGTISGASSVCAGATITLSTTGTGGTWASSNTAVATVNASGIVTGVATGTAIITYSATNGCGTAIATQAVTVNVAPVSGTISGSGTLCIGGVTALTTTGTGGTWSSSSLSIATVGYGVVFGVTTGTAIISYSLSNACGTATDTMLVTVITVPSTTISGPSAVCAGSSITITPTIGGGTWASSSTGVATVSGGTVTGLVAGLTLISYTTTNVCGTTLDTLQVTVNPLPYAGGITGASSVCPGSTITLSSTGSAGSWSSGATGTATIGATSGILTGVAAGTAPITYTVTNGCGTARAITSVTVNPAPTAGTISGGTTVCAGSTATLSSTSAGGTWSCTSSAASIAGTGVVTGISAGAAIITYTVSNSCGTATATYAVTINPLPDAGALSGPASVCAGASITLSPTVSVGSWATSSSAVANVSATGVVTGIGAGAATISYAVTNMCGTAYVTYAITVNPLPSAGTLTGPVQLCRWATITLTPSITGGTWASSNVAIASVAGGVVHGVAAGAANISYTVTNVCGVAYTTSPITVNPLPDAGSISGPDSVCVGGLVALTNTSSTGTWASSNPSVATVSATGAVTGVTMGSAIISYAAFTSTCGTALQTRNMNVRSGGGCPSAIKELTNTGSDGISVFPNPNEGLFTIAIPSHENDVVVTITDVHGRVVKTFTVADKKLLEIPVDMSHVAVGVYMLRAQVDNTIYYKKVVVM